MATEQAVVIQEVTPEMMPKVQEMSEENDSKQADFTFKMPTKLLSSTIGKSDTNSSHMLSYKFSKENVFQSPDNSMKVDRDGDEYLQ